MQRDGRCKKQLRERHIVVPQFRIEASHSLFTDCFKHFAHAACDGGPKIEDQLRHGSVGSGRIFAA
jgi:hypothetical protein